ncbi:ribonuclease H-like domain-containing protein [Tanacetum coccineum]
MLNNKGRVTDQREIRPVWNNVQRVSHQNKLTHPHPKSNFVPTVVAIKLGQVPINGAKQNSPRAATSISTARSVNTAAPKLKVNDALPKTYSYFKAHSSVRRAFNPKSAAKTYNLIEKVKTARVNNVTTAGPKSVVTVVVGYGENAMKSSASWIWRPAGNVIDHTSNDSGSNMFKRFDYIELQGRLNGFSRHMTVNKSFLTDYQEVDGRFFAFAGSPKGCKITGKCKIRTGKLDFEDVYFVKELKFNLFSVSQMCDKKNSVLFTKIECLVLSPDFNLLDERGLACLFAKAKIDESNLWHRRLGHINFKTIKKLVKGNLVRGLPSKLFENDHTCVACQKGKQHKASCKTKINRVLVTKPHNKTPYELLHGRPPSISFMRPFGCPVTILNTLDPLGKFDRKADEGFFVGYSINSKAFRVFNTRTRKVDENMHINFLENKPNVAGSRPDWLFDIDLLTNSMNYESVTAGNQTNKNAVANDDGKKTNQEPANKGERNDQKKEGGASNKEDGQNVQDFRVALDNLLWCIYNEDIGAKGNLNNFETTVNVNPIPLTRIHKDHPKDQIIGDINSATQTRRMTKIPEELAMVYVDDIIFGSTKKSLCTEFESLMHKKFQMSSIGELTFFLGLQTASTPIETNKALLKDEEAEEVDVHLYRSMIGSLMYLTAFRPDIMFDVCACARFQVTPTPRNSPFDLEAFSNSDYAGASIDRKSTTRGVMDSKANA